MSSPHASSQNKADTDLQDDQDRTPAEDCEDVAHGTSLKPTLKSNIGPRTDSGQDLEDLPRPESASQGAEAKSRTPEVKVGPPKRRNEESQALAKLSARSHESRMLQPGWDPPARNGTPDTANVEPSQVSTVKVEELEGLAAVKPPTVRAGRARGATTGPSQSPEEPTMPCAFGVQLRTTGRAIRPQEVALRTDYEGLSSTVLGAPPNYHDGLPMHKGHGRARTSSIAPTMNQDLQVDPHAQALKAGRPRKDHRGGSIGLSGRGVAPNPAAPNHQAYTSAKMNYLELQRAAGRGSDLASSNRGREGGRGIRSQHSPRDGVFSLTKPVQSYANTLQIFDKAKVNLFNKQRQQFEDNKPTAREIQMLLNEFKDEQVRLMQLQNQEFERDKRSFLHEIYKVETGSHFLGTKRGSHGGVNPILRFLSDEKSILHKHLQGKETPSVNLKKGTYLGKLLEKGKRSLSQTPRRQYLHSLNSNHNHRAEYHMRRFDFPPTENPYFVPPVNVDDTIDTQRTRQAGSGSPLSNQMLSNDKLQHLNQNSLFQWQTPNQAALQYLQPPLLHQEIQNKLFKNKFAKIKGKQGIERIIQQANKDRDTIKKAIAKDVQNLPHVLWELDQMKILGEYEGLTPRDVAAATARDAALWSSCQQNPRQSAQQGRTEHGKRNIHVDLNAPQTFGPPPQEDPAGADLNSITTPSLGMIYPVVSKQEPVSSERRAFDVQGKKYTVRAYKNKAAEASQARAHTLDKEHRKRFRSSLGGWQVAKSSMDHRQSSQFQYNPQQEVNNISGEGVPRSGAEVTQNAKTKSVNLRQVCNENLELASQDSQNQKSEVFSLKGNQNVDYQCRAKRSPGKAEGAASPEERHKDSILSVHGVQSSLNSQAVKQKILLSKANRNSSRDGSKSSEKYDRKSTKLNEDITTARQVAVLVGEPANGTQHHNAQNAFEQQLLVSTMDNNPEHYQSKQEPNASAANSARYEELGMEAANNQDLEIQCNTNQTQINMSHMNDQLTLREDYPMKVLDEALSKASFNSKKTNMAPVSASKLIAHSAVENDTNQTFSPIHSVRVNNEALLEYQDENDSHRKQRQQQVAAKVEAGGRGSAAARPSQIGKATITSTRKKPQSKETKPGDQSQRGVQHWQNVKNIHIVFNPESIRPPIQHGIVPQRVVDDACENQEPPTMKPRSTYNQHIHFQARRPTAPMMARRFMHQHVHNQRRRVRNDGKHETLMVHKGRRDLDQHVQKMEKRELRSKTAEANDPGAAVETRLGVDEWSGARNSCELKDGRRTFRGGSWSAKRDNASSYQSSADREMESATRKHQTPDRKKAGQSKSKVPWQPVELSGNSLSVEGRGQQEAISAFHAFRRQQHENSYMRKASEPCTPQNLRSMASPGAGKQVQLSVKMDQALSKENSSCKNQDLKSIGRFNLEDKVKDGQNNENIMIKDEDRKTIMKMSETQERKGGTVHNSSRASRDGAEESLFKNSRIDRHDISEQSKEHSRTKSRQDRGKNMGTENNAKAETSRHAEILDHERKSSATYQQNREPNQSTMLYSGYTKSSIKDMGNTLNNNEHQAAASERRGKQNDLRPRTRQQASVHGTARQQPINNPALISNSIYFKKAPDTARSKSRRQVPAVSGGSSKHSVKSKNQDLDFRPKDKIIKSEQFQVRVIKYPNSIKLMNLNNKSPPKTAGEDRQRRSHLSPARSIPRASRGLHDQIQHNQQIDHLTLRRGNRTQSNRLYPISRIGSPHGATEKAKPLPLPQQALILYQRNQEQKLRNLKRNANGLLMQQNEKMLLRPSTHLKKQNELKRVLETLSKRKALVLDEQKIFQMLMDEERQDHRKMQTIDPKKANREKKQPLYLLGENPQPRCDDLTEIAEIRVRGTQPRTFSLATPGERPPDPSKDGAIEYINASPQKQGGKVSHGPGTPQRSNNELELRVLSEGDAFEVRAPTAALSDSGDLGAPNDDLRKAAFDDLDAPDGARLTVLKQHTQQLLQKNLPPGNYYEHHQDL